MMTAMKVLSLTASLMLIFAVPASAQTKKTATKDDSMRAECFRQANERVNSLGPMAPAAEKNTEGADVYRSCMRRAGLRP